MTCDAHIEIWFVTGSQHLYGPETLERVRMDSEAIAKGVSASAHVSVPVICKPTMTTPDAITHLCNEANADPHCIGLILWMHTFSPAKMWIAGLSSLRKPFLHLHTQYNREIPWTEIDMDFMNLNQSAHGGKEFGHICTRLKKHRKVVVGYWQDADTLAEIGQWQRVVAAWHDAGGMKIARFGDNMREVAVTEGDKIEAQYRLGYTVNGYGLGDLTRTIDDVTESETHALLAEYEDRYTLAEDLCRGRENRTALIEAAKIEAGLARFLEENNFKAFTTTFENLSGLTQLPGLAVQRLMARGYGFGAEGDWKTAALVRTVKVMGQGGTGGTSFMEDYTYHLVKDDMLVLGAHMLEVCESIADPESKPLLSVSPLSIGGKADPARLIFDARPGPGLNASLVDLGDRFRLIVNNVTVVKPPHQLPKLPVARAIWRPLPDLKTAAAAWIYAGGSHHTSFSQSVTSDCLEEYTAITGIEYLLIDADTKLPEFRDRMRWNASC